jgi:hypothetical protein
LVVLGLVGALLWWQWGRRGPSLSLGQYTDVAAFVAPPPGVGWKRVEEYRAVREAAEASNPEHLVDAMRAAGLRGLWVAVTPGSSTGPDQPLVERMAAGGSVRGFRGEALTSSGLLYVLYETTWPPAIADRVLARVARGILEGLEPPSLEDFPKALATEQSVEVLVMLTGSRGPRLWRSARAQSIAEGLITASAAARKRWEERAETMGGSLDARLDQLDVHVAILVDDGTFDRDAVSLIDALVKPLHGVAYEQPSRWRYLLPRATHNADSATDAFRRLFRDNGLPEESFGRRDLRLYRMRMRTVSVHQGSAGSSTTGAFD